MFPPFFFVRSIGETNRRATRLGKPGRFPESLAKLFLSSVGAQRPGHGPCFRAVCYSSIICLSCIFFDGVFFSRHVQTVNQRPFTKCGICSCNLPTLKGVISQVLFPISLTVIFPVRNQLASNVQQKITRGAPRNTRYSVTTNCASTPHRELSVQRSKYPSSV